jgi:hypothetical protein
MNAISLINYSRRTSIHTPIYDSDFDTTETNVEELRQEEGINPDDWKVYNDESELNLPECDEKYWKTVNRQIVEMTAEEKSTKDSDILDTAKQNKILQIKSLAKSTILSQYPDFKQRNASRRSLNNFKKVDGGESLTAKEQAYQDEADTIDAFIENVIDQCDTMESTVEAFSTIEQVESFTIAYT